MRTYRFICYCQGRERAAFDCDQPNVAAACLVAEYLLSTEADLFYDKIRFFSVDSNLHRIPVYSIEKVIEPSEKYGL